MIQEFILGFLVSGAQKLYWDAVGKTYRCEIGAEFDLEIAVDALESLRSERVKGR